MDPDCTLMISQLAASSAGSRQARAGPASFFKKGPEGLRAQLGAMIKRSMHGLVGGVNRSMGSWGVLDSKSCGLSRSAGCNTINTLPQKTNYHVHVGNVTRVT